MYNLLNFLKKYFYVILFLILEVVCITLLLNNLPYHRRLLVSLGNSISGRFLELRNGLTSYLSLAEENEKLLQQNKQLLSALYRMNDSLTDTVAYKNILLDTVKPDTSRYIYNFIPAKVIDNNIYHTRNYLIIDKGRKHGIKKDMGVICENGIVGKIANVSNNYSSVISMLHPYSVISARFIENQHIANVHWDCQDYRFGLVKDIPFHLDLRQGDTLVTSGFSNVYPANIMVGTIEETMECNSEMFNTAKIRFSTNFSSIQNVFVVENLFQTEIDSLTINFEDNE